MLPLPRLTGRTWTAGTSAAAPGSPPSLPSCTWCFGRGQTAALPSPRSPRKSSSVSPLSWIYLPRRHHLYKESASEAQESWARERHLKGLSPFITCCTLNSRLLGRSRNFPSPLSKKSLRKGQFKSLNLTPFSPTGQASRLLSIATDCQGLRVKGPHWLSWDGAKQTAGTLTAQA